MKISNQDYNTADYYNTEEAAEKLKTSIYNIRKRLQRGKYEDVVPCKCTHKSQLIAKSEIESELHQKEVLQSKQR
jgi:hypothetical protein